MATSLRFTIFADGFETRQSAKFETAIEVAVKLARKYQGHVVEVNDALGQVGEAYICHPDGYVGPA